jgi:hypothetical protein
MDLVHMDIDKDADNQDVVVDSVKDDKKKLQQQVTQQEEEML